MESILAQAMPTPVMESSSQYLSGANPTKISPNAPMARQAAWVRVRPNRSASPGSTKEKAKQTAEYNPKQIFPQATPSAYNGESVPGAPKISRATAVVK